MEITRKSGKKHVLSVFALVMINIIAIDSLRNLPVNAVMGVSIFFYYLAGGLLFLIPSALITAELATHHPKTGGAYVWVREAFGRKWGFISIWLQWIYNVIWYPTILSFVAANVAYLINPALVNNKIYMASMVVGLFSIGTLVNCFGMSLSGLTSILSAIGGTIIPMLSVIVLGGLWMLKGHPLAIEPTVKNFVPSLHMDTLAFLVVVLFSLMGLEMSASHAEEVKNPERDYPRALYYSGFLIMVSLMLASVAIAIVIPKSNLNIISGLDQAFELFLSAFHLKWLMPVVVLLIILGGFGGMAAWVIGPTRGLQVAAEDECTPKIFRKKNAKGAPIAILLLQWLIVLILSGLFVIFKFIGTWYWILSDLTAQLALLFYILMFAAAIRLRYKTPFKQHAFRIPGGKLGVWIVAMIGIITSIVAIFFGFLPPTGVQISSTKMYEALLIGGMILFTLPPIFIYKIQKKRKA